MTATSDDRQQRPGLWKTVNERYPGSMISKTDTVPLAPLRRPLSEARLTFVSTAGVQPNGTLPFDVVHPVGTTPFDPCRPTAPRWIWKSTSLSTRPTAPTAIST